MQDTTAEPKLDKRAEATAATTLGRMAPAKAPPQGTQRLKHAPINLDNSLFCTVPRPAAPSNDAADADDSFLEWERQCNMDEQKEQILNADETCLFDIEPPSELFNQTVNQTCLPTISPNESSDCIEMSPVKYIGLIRPSTIYEETSSQFDSSSKITETSVSSTRSLSGSSQMDAAEDKDTTKPPIRSESKPAPGASTSSHALKDRSRRETFAFKRTNYTFFGADTNLETIDESASLDGDAIDQNTADDKDLLEFDDEFDASVTEESKRHQFNDTIEAIDYFLAEGRKMIEQTPVANRDAFQRSVIETPLFSCKRKRIMSEMANEMLPLPKRGPLIDFSTPETEKKSRAHKKLLD